MSKSKPLLDAGPKAISAISVKYNVKPKEPFEMFVVHSVGYIDR